MTRRLAIAVLVAVGGALVMVAARSGVRPVAAFPVTWEVTKGEVWGVPIGASTERVVEELRIRGSRLQIFAELPNPIRVRHGDDIGALASVEWIVVTPGTVRFEFAGDAVVSRRILVGLGSAPALRSMEPRLSTVQTRAEVLPLVAELLASDPREVAMEHDPREGWFDLYALSAEERVALDELGSWSVSDRNFFGWWRARFEFREARLAKVTMSWRPFELAL